MVGEELIPTTNYDQQGQEDYRGQGYSQGRGRRRDQAHVSPIKPMVEHAYHQRP